MPTLYTVLGVPENATPAVIKSAFRKLSMQYHPDRNPGNPAAEARFREILEAYRILSEPDDRLRYDRELAWSRIPVPPRTSQAHTSPPNYTRPEYRTAAPPATPPRPMPWKLMGIILGGLILFFVCLYHFGPLPDPPEEREFTTITPEKLELPSRIASDQQVVFTNGDTLAYGAWHREFSTLQFNESWQPFGPDRRQALYVTVYFTPDRHSYQDFVFRKEETGYLRQVFHYRGGTYKSGVHIRLYFGRDVEPEGCGDCEAENLPSPGIAGIYLRETSGGYRFETASQGHESKIRKNLAWLANNALYVDLGEWGVQRQFLRQILTWHFLHRVEGSAEAVFREYYHQPDVDEVWQEIARMIKAYENKIAFDILM